MKLSTKQLKELVEIKSCRDLWRKNFFDFVVDGLGHKRNDELRWGDLSKDHKELCEFLQFSAEKFKLVLMPRCSLKSCITTVGYALWRLTQNPNLRILIYSDKNEKAEGFLADIKNHISGEAGGSQFRRVFGNWVDTNKWTLSQIVVKPRTAMTKEPSVDTSGIDASKVGLHYDIILFDDIVTDLNVTTKSLMDKTYDCFKKSLSLLIPGGEVIVVGTRWSFGDAYGRMIADNAGEWGVFVRQAVVDGRHPFASIGLTPQFLAQQRKQQGSFLFSCLYLNTPVDDDTQLFKPSGFKFYGDSILTEGLYITGTCDPAGVGDDYSAFTVVGTDKNLRMFLLYASQKKFKPHEIVDEIIRLNYRFKFVKFGIETNLFEGMLETELDRAMKEERGNPNWAPFSVEVFRSSGTSRLGKEARVRGLQPFHERGDLVFPGTSIEESRGAVDELIQQMLQWTASHKPPHDDLIDSLAFHVQLVRRGHGDKKDLPKEDSIAAWVNRDIERYNRMQRRIPKRYRQVFQPIEL